MKPTVFLFDIDGTLIDTGGAGRRAMVSVFSALYGHPNPSLLARLSRGGARILRTDQGGDLAAVRTGSGLAVVARGDPPR